MTKEKALQDYMMKAVPSAVNDIGNFFQYSIKEAYMKGYEDAMAIALPSTQHITEFTNRHDSDLVYRRSSGGLFYLQLKDMIGALADLPPLGYGLTKFSDSSTFAITEVVNNHNVVIRCGDKYNYCVDGVCGYKVHSLKEVDGQLYATIGPSVGDYILTSENGRFTTIDIDHIESVIYE